MTGPSSTSRGERAGTPGSNWETELARTETVVDDPDTAVPGMNEPLPPRPNRETRRALARKARREK